MELVNGTSKIEVKLTTSGRYTWSISIVAPTHEFEDSTHTLNSIDKALRQEFPDYARRGSGRIASLDEQGWFNMMNQQNPIQGAYVPPKKGGQDVMAQMMELAKQLSPEEMQQMMQMMSKMIGA